MDDIQRRHEIHNAASGIDIRILHIPDGLHHEQPLILAVNGLMVLVMQDRLIRPDPHIKIAELRRLPEKLHMSAVQQIVTP